MDKIYDIAIVGAGPAGSIFARELSRTRPELSIAIIDGQTEKNKKPCGGLLAPDAQKALAEFDLTLPNRILSDPQIFTVKTMDLESGAMRYYQRHYLNMDRYRFDRWLFSFVPEAVTVISSRVEDIEKCESFRLKLTDGEIYAKIVVGADGGGSIVRRKLYGKLPRQYISIQEWYKSNGEGLPFYSCIFDRETSDSCSWIIHKNDFVIYGGAFEKKGCKEAFAAQKRRVEEFAGVPFGEPMLREACLVTSPRSPSELVCGGDGFFLLGEAAGFISASSYEGISSAIISARRLAEAFGQAETTAGVLKRYKKKTVSLRLKLTTKMFKRAVLCSPNLRKMIMKSGVSAVNVK